VASELAFLQYAMDDLDSMHLRSEESRIQRGVDIIYELNKLINNILVLLNNSLKTNTSVFIQIVANSDEAIIRAFDTKSKYFTKEHTISLNSNIYQFAISKQSAFQKQSDSALNQQLGYYESEEEAIHSVLIIPIIEAASVIALIVVDSIDKKIFTKEDILLTQKYADFILEQIRIFKMLKESEEKATQFQMLSYISSELMQSLKLNAILEKLLDYCKKAVSYDACLLALKNKNTINLMIQRGFDGAAKKLKIDQCKNWTGWFLSNREEPLLLSDVSTNKMPLWDHTERIKHWREVFMIPIMRKSSVIGTLLFASEKKVIFKSHIRTMLAIIANHASVIIENAMLYERTELLAITDGLTEIPNHRYFQETLSNYLEKAKQNNEKVSLIIVDIDFFKKINDTFGHQFGDKVLKKVASILKNNIREDDFVARYGGEEFAIILNDCDEENAIKVAEKIRKKVQKNDWASLKEKFNVTVSMGIASYPDAASNKNDLIKFADAALYQAKETGRNKVVASKQLQ
jgi:diguanylate cyclase (GGDEF)-like protein